MPVLELCAGYGGLGMAVEVLTGERVAYVAENDHPTRNEAGEITFQPAASKVLAARYPDVPNIGDITAYDWSQLKGQIDIITAGFPCQDISNAGKRKGITGERSSVWRHVAESVFVLRPRLVFLENVSVLLRRGLDVVLGDLAEIGYDAMWTCLRASDIGAPHPRERWFAVAYPQGDRRSQRWAESAKQQGSLRLVAGCDCQPAPDTPHNGQGKCLTGGLQTEVPWAPSGRSAAENSHCPAGTERIRAASRQAPGRRSRPDTGRGQLSASPAEWWGDRLPAIRRWEHIIGRPAPAASEFGPRGGRRLTADFAEWLMGLPAGWVTGVPGLTRAQQLHAIGNGVVPQQAYAAYSHLFHVKHREVIHA